MNWTRLGERDRRAVLLGGVVLTLGLFLRLMAYPFTEALRDAGERLERERSLLEQEERVLLEAKSYQRDFSELGTRFLASVPRLMKGGTLSATQATLSGQVDRAALSARVLLRRVEPLPAHSAGAGVRAVSLRLEGESDFEGLMTFLAEMEAGPVVYHISELEIREENGRARTSTVAGPVVIAFRLLVTGFVLEDLPGPPAMSPDDEGGAAPPFPHEQ